MISRIKNFLTQIPFNLNYINDNLPSLRKLLIFACLILPFLVLLNLGLSYLLNFWAGQAEEIVNDSVYFVIDKGWIEFDKKMKNEPDFYPTCSSNMFDCTPNPWDYKVKSLPWMRRCDGHKNCWDGSDEKDCKECLTSFSCKAEDGIHLKCLGAENLCDGFSDCPDSSDELLYCHRNTTCSEDEFSCDEQKNGYHKCFPYSFKCDGDHYCPETEPFKCEECQGFSRQCTSVWALDGSVCVPITKVCDGIVNCMDHRDEKFLHCNQSMGECPGQCNMEKDAENEAHRLMSINMKFMQVTGEFHLKNFRCSDNKWYSPVLACSGEHPECDGQCKSCMGSAFYCKEDKKCISSAKVCDGIKDCSDGFDEKDCNMTLACDAESRLCDGVCNCLPDCHDEKNCARCQEHAEFKNDEVFDQLAKEDPKTFNLTHATSWIGRNAKAFFCPKEKTCISITKRCDGKEDCLDGHDEKDCRCFECMMHPHQMYMCQKGKRCFRFEEVCDENFGSKCPNATQLDEEHCLLLKVKSDKVKLY